MTNSGYDAICSPMNTLMVSPQFPETFWSLKHAVEFSSAKSTFPPLGLLTVGAMLPQSWPKKLVDLNVQPLTEAHLEWADLVLVSAMTVQSASADEVLERCRAKGVTTIVGGPHYFHMPDGQDLPGATAVIGEAEEVMPGLLKDLEAGKLRPIYRADHFPDITGSPRPLWSLVPLPDYTDVSLQFTRGCPFNCEFCDVVLLSGRRPRLKTNAQVLGELDLLHQAGWRGEVMFVDDNFIGNKKQALSLLKDIGQWQKQKGYPFWFMTQASLNLADDSEMLALMNEAGFKKVFIGIETPIPASLAEAGKHQNQGQDIVAAVRKCQQAGQEVLGGFIVGFDSDPPSVFDDQFKVIQESGIPAAMVGLLSAPPGSPLWKRLESEGRLLGMPSGDNAFDKDALNFEPVMGRDRLLAGYKEVVSRLYAPSAYFDRVLLFFDNYRPSTYLKPPPLKMADLKSFLAILWHLGVKAQWRLTFWGFLARVLVKHPRLFPEAVISAACGHHFFEITRKFIKSDS